MIRLSIRQLSGDFKTKAQVFPLAKSDFVGTGLTHSLEVSCVGRSLGTEVGAKLHDINRIPDWIEPGDIGNIVAAACLAHDIGNPPFGHSGEAAIGKWFSQNVNGKKLIQNMKLAGRQWFWGLLPEQKGLSCRGETRQHRTSLGHER